MRTILSYNRIHLTKEGCYAGVCVYIYILLVLESWFLREWYPESDKTHKSQYSESKLFPFSFLFIQTNPTLMMVNPEAKPQQDQLLHPTGHKLKRVMGRIRDLISTKKANISNIHMIHTPDHPPYALVIFFHTFHSFLMKRVLFF